MVIAPWSTCDYEATVEEIRRNETIWAGRERLSRGKRLAGRTPRICVDQRRISITAQSPKDATCRQVVVPAGDAIFKTCKAGDTLYLSHTPCATFGVSLIRQNELILALGAVTHVPLGKTVSAKRGPALSSTTDECLEDTWLEVSNRGDTQKIRSRQVLTVGAYEVYLERAWNVGIPGDDEQASIAVATEEGLAIAAVRSTILLANARGDSSWRDWDDR